MQPDDFCQAILEAMDGISLVLDRELRIVRLGARNWARFYEQNPVPSGCGAGLREPASVLNRPIADFIAGREVRETYGRIFRSVLEGCRGACHIDYRCDAPAVRRDMRLSLTPLEAAAFDPGAGGCPRLLYQSIQLTAVPRVPIALFGVPVSDSDEAGILTLCAICARVAWPAGAGRGAREWVEAGEYYRRGGAEVARISHGFCEPCFHRLQAEEAG